MKMNFCEEHQCFMQRFVAKSGGYYECPKCNNPKLPHTACSNCGYVRPGLSIQLEKES